MSELHDATDPDIRFERAREVHGLPSLCSGCRAAIAAHLLGESVEAVERVSGDPDVLDLLVDSHKALRALPGTLPATVASHEAFEWLLSDEPDELSPSLVDAARREREIVQDP